MVYIISTAVLLGDRIRHIRLTGTLTSIQSFSREPCFMMLLLIEVVRAPLPAKIEQLDSGKCLSVAPTIALHLQWPPAHYRCVKL